MAKLRVFRLCACLLASVMRRAMENVPDSIQNSELSGTSTFLLKPHCTRSQIVHDHDTLGFRKVKKSLSSGPTSASTPYTLHALGSEEGAAAMDSHSWEEFSHPHFRRGRRDLLAGIKRQQQDKGRSNCKKGSVGRRLNRDTSGTTQGATNPCPYVPSFQQTSASTQRLYQRMIAHYPGEGSSACRPRKCPVKAKVYKLRTVNVTAAISVWYGNILPSVPHFSPEPLPYAEHYSSHPREPPPCLCFDDDRPLLSSQTTRVGQATRYRGKTGQREGRPEGDERQA